MAERSAPATRRNSTRSPGAGQAQEPARGRPQQRAAELIKTGKEQFAAVAGVSVEAVSAFSKDGDGFQLQVEVLELARIPDTTSLLATYRVRLDSSGGISGYERIRRYARGQVDT